MILADTSKIRTVIQTLFALFCLYIGYRFYLFLAWATGSRCHHVMRPPAVEAFLPIGALVSLKQLILTGIYDPVHPAGLTVFIMVLAVSLVFRKGFCGWICPIGFASELANSAAGRLWARINGKSRHFILRLPTWLSYPLLGLKYLLLGFFIYLVVWKMDINSLQSFNRSPYNLTVDGRMLRFFLAPSSLALGIMLGIVIVTLVFRNFWCRFLCPYGALLGLLALASPFQLRRQPEKCIDCKKCEDICPAVINITGRKTVRTPECIGCLDCAAVCPQNDCLNLTFVGVKNTKPLILPGGLLLLFFAVWAWARLSGHWQTAISDEIFKKFYTLMNL